MGRTSFESSTSNSTTSKRRTSARLSIESTSSTEKSEEKPIRKAPIGKKVPLLSAAYLEHFSNKNDLVRRLRLVVDALSDEDLEAHTEEHPGLDGLSASLVKDTFLNHKDKEVRLHTCLACMELFYLYAPEPPWNEKEILAIFSQTIRQLGNLSHCTSPSQMNFQHYFRLLEQLSTVKIGVVLVELVRINELDTKITENEPLEMLTSLIRTVLSCVQVDHPPEVSSHAISTVSACIEEFVSTVPIPILDEILTQIGAGPITLVTNPAAVEYAARVAEAKKKRNSPPKEKAPPSQIQQTNQSYLVAASVIKRTEDRIANPISSLLNGLLNNLSEITEKTAIATVSNDSNDIDVYSIVYELHRIAPPILTTIIGTVASNLKITDSDSRYLVVKLLGRLFYSKNGTIAETYVACCREWVRRYKDVDTKIRKLMVQCLILLLAHHKPKEIRDLATQALVDMIGTDPDVNVRIDAIHQVCDLAHEDPSVISPKLVQAVGGRIASKHKTERKDAATGLAQCYFKHFCTKVCGEIEKGGEDVDLSIILDALEEKEEEFDTDTFYGRNHVKAQFGWIPTEIFKAACFTDQVDSDMRNRIVQVLDDVLMGSPGKLSSTSKAVALCTIMDTIKGTDAERWLGGLLSQRSALQKGLDRYISARSETSSLEPNSEEYLVSDAAALGQLERVLSLSAPCSGIAAKTMVEKIHSHRDKHVFRILSTISCPRHSPSARARAFKELPKRTQSLGEPTSTWIKMLTRRCAMGGSINEEVVAHCILLAQECFREEEYEKAMMMLAPVDFVSKSFPDLIIGRAFTNLIELLGECREVSLKNKKETEMRQTMVTCISAILARSAPAAGKNNEGTKEDKEKEKSLFTDLQNNLIRLCTKDGTPEQSRFAVEVLHSFKEPDSLENLLKQLTSPQKLRVGNKHILSILSALSTLVETNPKLFDSVRGTKAVRFAFESILLGKEEDAGEDENEIPNKEEKQGVGRRTRRAVATKELQLSTRRNCAAIDFLTTHVRASIKFTQKQAKKLPSNEHIESLFQVLFQIVEDKGIPPSSRDATNCDMDLAALREYAAINILRLCDPSLQLTDTYIKPRMWNVLGSCLLDSNKEVRENIIIELSQMLTGQAKYCHGISYAPSLRFLSLVCLCVDSESHLSSFNSNAATIGKASQVLKQSALKCIQFLRKTSESTLARCRAMGSSAEANFEGKYKFILMPEYAVPYALHMICFREETPQSDTDDKTVLKKRLKWLLDPMVGSLGISADNISFLLRMTELIGNRYLPYNENQEADRNRVKIVCDAAREILLKFVKKDINLTVYPGQIQIPSLLFRPRPRPQKLNSPKKPSSVQAGQVPSTEAVDVKRKATENDQNKNDNLKRKTELKKQDTSSPQSPKTPLETADFGDLSPILRSKDVKGKKESFVSPPASILRKGRINSGSRNSNVQDKTQSTVKNSDLANKKYQTPPDKENFTKEKRKIDFSFEDQSNFDIISYDNREEDAKVKVTKPDSEGSEVKLVNRRRSTRVRSTRLSDASQDLSSEDQSNFDIDGHEMNKEPPKTKESKRDSEASEQNSVHRRRSARVRSTRLSDSSYNKQMKNDLSSEDEKGHFEESSDDKAKSPSSPLNSANENTSTESKKRKPNLTSPLDESNTMNITETEESTPSKKKRSSSKAVSAEKSSHVNGNEEPRSSEKGLKTPVRKRLSTRIKKTSSSESSKTEHDDLDFEITDRDLTPETSSSEKGRNNEKTKQSPKRKNKSAKQKPILIKINRPESLSSRGSKSPKSTGSIKPPPQSQHSAKKKRGKKKPEKIDEFDFEFEDTFSTQTSSNNSNKNKKKSKSSKKAANKEKSTPKKRLNRGAKHKIKFTSS